MTKLLAVPSGTLTTKRYVICSPIESNLAEPPLPVPASLVWAKLVLFIDFTELVISTVTVAESVVWYVFSEPFTKAQSSRF